MPSKNERYSGQSATAINKKKQKRRVSEKQQRRRRSSSAPLGKHQSPSGKKALNTDETKASGDHNPDPESATERALAESKVGRTLLRVQELHEQMRDNIQTAWEQQGLLEDLDERATFFEYQARMFKYAAKTLKRNVMMRNMKTAIALIVTVLILLALAAALVNTLSSL